HCFTSRPITFRLFSRLLIEHLRSRRLARPPPRIKYGVSRTLTAIKAWYARHPRFHIHFTPTSSSWINQVERFFGLLTQRQIRRGTFRSTVALEKTIRAYLDAHNRQPKPFVWVKTADEILESVKRFCLRTSGSRH
ncbi:MAG: hypothetical protein ABIQ65_11315, partial [Thermoanaerobaculia bacterium]